MSAPLLPDHPVLQRSCFLCGAVDDGPRNTLDLGGGRAAFAHLPGSADCGVPGADPHPDINESTTSSQLRAALTLDPLSPTPGPAPLDVPEIDAQDAANFYRDVEDLAPRLDHELAELGVDPASSDTVAILHVLADQTPEA